MVDFSFVIKSPNLFNLKLKYSVKSSKTCVNLVPVESLNHLKSQVIIQSKNGTIYVIINEIKHETLNSTPINRKEIETHKHEIKNISNMRSKNKTPLSILF